MVKRGALLKGHLVQEAMLTDITLLNPTTTLEEVIEIILKGTEKQFMVVDVDEILGIVDHKTVLQHAKEPNRPVAEIMNKEVQVIEASAEITKALELLAKRGNEFLAVTRNKLLVGAIDRANIGEFILLQTNLSAE